MKHLLALVVAAWCGAACGPPPLTIDVTVGDGVEPEVAFDGDGASSLQAYDVPGADVSVFCGRRGDGVSVRSLWSLRTIDNSNGISSPVTYGSTPAGVVGGDAEPLVAGSPVCIEITRSDAEGYVSDMGIAVFTP